MSDDAWNTLFGKSSSGDDPWSTLFGNTKKAPEGPDESSLGPVTHAAAVMGERALHAVPGVVGFVGDLGAEVVPFIKNMAQGGMHVNSEHVMNSLSIPGSGPVGQAVEQAYRAGEKAAGITPPTPRNAIERYLGAGSEMAAASLVGAGPENAGKAVLSGITSGVAGEGAKDLFPNNPVAQLAGMVLGGLTPAGLEAAARRAPQLVAKLAERFPNSGEDLNGLIRHLEGGGTLENPAVSPKGAKGPMQVMDATARDPGFGIKPWDGKTEADRARVGEQYAAKMAQKYGGDKEKILAAYNAGPGRVDELLAKYGENWKDHLPTETQHYLDRAGLTGGSTGGSVPPIDPEQLRKIMEQHQNDTDLANIAFRDIPHEDNVVDFQGAQEKKTLSDMGVDPYLSHQIRNQDISDLPDWMIKHGQEFSSDHIADMIDRIRNDGENISLKQARVEAEEAKQLGATDYQDHLTPAERQEMDASAPKPDVTGINPSVPYEEPPVPANDARQIVGDLPQERLAPAILNKDGRIFVGDENTTHMDTLNKYPGLEDHAADSGGFVTPDGKYLTREEAAQYVGSHDKGLESLSYNRETTDEHGKQTSHTPLDMGPAWGDDPPKKPPSSGNGGVGGEGPPPEENAAVQKLQAAVQRARPLRKIQDTIYHEERSKRYSKMQEAGKLNSGREAFLSRMSAAGGELPKVDFEGIRHQMEPHEIDQLHDIINNKATWGEWEKAKAGDALEKVLGDSRGNDPQGSAAGKLPQPGELRLLADAFGDDFAKALMQKVPMSNRVKDILLSALTIPRAIRASFDLSAPLRQGINLIYRKEFFTAFAKMFTILGKNGFEKLQNEIASRPTFPMMQRAGLSLTYVDRFTSLSEREEQFMSKFVEDLPGIKHSERAYVGFLNKLRADTFDSMYKKSIEAGIDFRENPKALKDIGTFINNATGRGELPSAIKAWQPALNATLFSPRLMSSRIRMLTQVLRPETYLNMNPVVRQEYFKSMLATGAIISTVIGLAKMNGAEVETDPASSDWGKIKIGNLRKDLWGGYQQYAKLAYSMATGRLKSVTTGEKSSLNDVKFGGQTRKDVLLQTLVFNKENPTAATVDDLLTWPKPKFGEKITPGRELRNLFLPMVMDDIRQAYNDNGYKGAAMSADSFFGTGNQIIPPKTSKSKSGDPWKQAFGKDDKAAWATVWGKK